MRHCLEQVSSHRWLPGAADDRNESFAVFKAPWTGPSTAPQRPAHVDDLAQQCFFVLLPEVHLR